MCSLSAHQIYLTEEEREPLTIEKYMRDVKQFMTWLADRELSKKK